MARNVRKTERGRVYFIGAGPGDPDLLTVRGARILSEADRIVFAGSLVPEEALHDLNDRGLWVDSAGLNREEIVGHLVEGAAKGEIVVRLASGDPSIFGAMAEMTTELDSRGSPWEEVPGGSSVFAAAAALRMELTLPEVSQTVILTRTAGRTPMPPGEEIEALASHGATLVVFLSIDRIEDLVSRLATVRDPETPVAVVARASWDNEVVCRGTLATIAGEVRKARIMRQALLIMGEALDPERRKKARSRLYAADFTHGFREGSHPDPSSRS